MACLSHPFTWIKIDLLIDFNMAPRNKLQLNFNHNTNICYDFEISNIFSKGIWVTWNRYGIPRNSGIAYHFHEQTWCFEYLFWFGTLQWPVILSPHKTGFTYSNIIYRDINCVFYNFLRGDFVVKKTREIILIITWWWVLYSCRSSLLRQKSLPASTENLPLDILAVEHTPYTKYLGPK